MVRFVLFVLLAGCSRGTASWGDPSQMFLDPGECGSSAILDLLNDPSTTVDTLDAIGLHARARKNLLARRNGPDREAGTLDDQLFGDLAAVDAVPQVGAVAMQTLLAYAEGACAGDVPDTCPTDRALAFVNDAQTGVDDLVKAGVYGRGAQNLVAGRPFASLQEVDAVAYVGDSSMKALDAYGVEACTAELILSPTWYDDSHLSRLHERLDAAGSTVDVAMYSLSDYGTLQRLIDTAARGVSIRLILDSAKGDADKADGGRSAILEEAGIDVRYVNKIMHHKFALIDGPRTALEDAETGVLVTSSANWSYSGATKHDENTVFLAGDARLNLLYQREFELLWDNSRDFAWNPDLPVVEARPVTDADLAAAEGSDALFTTANFRTYTSSVHGATFARNTDTWHVSESLADLIRDADHSIRIASGHFRSQPIADAVLERAARGDIDIRVYVDGQEYVSDWYYGQEMGEWEACMATATDAGDVADCTEQGVHYAQALVEAGVDVRFKYYAYRWDYSYAPQMHNKYLVIDEDLVATGSYNFSPNAEFDTVENVALLSAERYPNLVASFVEAFDGIWDTGRDRYAPLVDEIAHGTEPRFDIVFEPMALDREQVVALKSLIADHCPEINSEAFRTDPAHHRTCDR